LDPARHRRPNFLTLQQMAPGVFCCKRYGARHRFYEGVSELLGKRVTISI